MAISLGLVGLFVGLGLSALPSGAPRGDTGLRLIDTSAVPARTVAAGIGAPVFALRPDGTAVRFGDASQDDAGTIRLALYDPLDPRMASATEALSLPGDLRLIWLLASEQERQQLRQLAGAVMAGASQSLLAVVGSDAFQADYRDDFVDMARTALTEAWTDGSTQSAWQALLSSSEPVLRDIVGRTVHPIVARHFEGVLGPLLRANATRMWPIFDHSDWDTTALDQAIADTVADIRARGIPEQAVTRLLAPREVTQFLRVFLAVAGDRLLHGSQLLDLLARMALDHRFAPALQAASTAAENLARTAPRLMISLHGSTDLNLVASFVIRTLAAGRRDRVVVLMSGAQARAIAALDPRNVHWLRMAPVQS